MWRYLKLLIKQLPAQGGTDGFCLSSSPDKQKKLFLSALCVSSEAGGEYTFTYLHIEAEGLTN